MASQYEDLDLPELSGLRRHSPRKKPTSTTYKDATTTNDRYAKVAASSSRNHSPRKQSATPVPPQRRPEKATIPAVVEPSSRVEQQPPRMVLGELPIPILAPVAKTMPAVYEISDNSDSDVEIGTTISATSNNRSLPTRARANMSGSSGGLKLTHVDSLLLPLSKIAIRDVEESEDDEPVGGGRRSPRKTTGPSKCKRKAVTAGQFVLGEAKCDNDTDPEIDDEDENTDLSGFIVDDDAELSVYEDSGPAGPPSRGKLLAKAAVGRPKRLQRGSPRKGSTAFSDSDLDCSNKENESDGQGEANLYPAIGSLQLEGQRERSHKYMSKQEIEVIDLTSSPASRSDAKSPSRRDVRFPQSSNNPSQSDSTNSLTALDAALHLSPPLRPTTPTKASKNSILAHPKGSLNHDTVDRPHTPTTPEQASPSKSKLQLSPSKRARIPHSPHRQSTDAFWDLDTVNTWNERYSPKKVIASPRKALDRFLIWEDSDVEINDDDNSQNEERGEEEESKAEVEEGPFWNDIGLPSPQTSPRKKLDFSSTGQKATPESPTKKPNKPPSTSNTTTSRSPTKPARPCKSPTKPSTATTAASERRAMRQRKAAFEAARDGIARRLLSDLDANVTGGKLGNMAASTGGVRVVWSKTLRSTAGRACWRRTVSKGVVGGAGSSSPDVEDDIERVVVGHGEKSVPVTGAKAKEAKAKGVTVQHYASVELASKIVDDEERLVNTLAHEFCHLANFMVSGVRDRPHGVEFKAWAWRVEGFLRGKGREGGGTKGVVDGGGGEDRGMGMSEAERRARAKVVVSTRHGYVIDYRFVWICVGRRRPTSSSSSSSVHLDGATGGEEGRGGDDGDGDGNDDDEGDEGCGAEYGRHSKSVDPDRQRCGRCKGLLVQVKPRPRGPGGGGGGGLSPVKEGKVDDEKAGGFRGSPVKKTKKEEEEEEERRKKEKKKDAGSSGGGGGGRGNTLKGLEDSMRRIGL